MAKALRAACRPEMAWVSQDLIRRVILKERDRPGAVNIGLIDQVARYALDHGYHVVLDGIFYADRYEPMLAGPRPFGPVPLLLPGCRPGGAGEFGAREMGDWYRSRDLLATIREHVIPETSTVQQTIGLVAADAQPPQPAPTSGAGP